jgi:hypothetical protein
VSDWNFLNKHRLRVGTYGSRPEDGFNGAFSFAVPGEARRLFCIASNGGGWEHVSVSFGAGNQKTPSWEVMCTVKDLFWEPEAPVMQLHPAKSEWVSIHNGCLHLWRPINGEIPLPPSIMVGPRESQIV